MLSLFKDGFALLDAIESDKLQPFMLKMLCILQQATNEMSLINKEYMEFLIQGLQKLLQRNEDKNGNSILIKKKFYL